VARRAPLLAEVMPHVAHPQIRNRGTVGGSLAHADPAAELPAALLALEACYRARSTRGERWIAAENFSTGLFATALEPDELLVEVVVPAAPGRAGFGFAEMARRHGDYALAGVAVRVTLDEGGRLAGARIVLLSVGDGPVRAREAETALTGQPPSAELLHAAAEAAAQRDTDPPSDIHASAAFRRRLVETLTRRTLTTALERARVASA
jgi:CO/xanthine dehydrogenase FAD-binding subunit